MPQKAASVRRQHVKAFTEDQLKKWEPATAANRYGGLRSFFRWLEESLLCLTVVFVSKS